MNKLLALLPLCVVLAACASAEEEAAGLTSEETGQVSEAASSAPCVTLLKACNKDDGKVVACTIVEDLGVGVGTCSSKGSKHYAQECEDHGCTATRLLNISTCTCL